MKVETLPIIDISGLRAGEGKAAMEVGRQINEACASIGFFYVTDHGVAAETIDEAVNAGKEFFHLPLEEKRRVAVNARHRGFNALGDATMYGASKPDYKEFYSMGLELAADDADVVAGEPLRGPNNWPEQPPEFRPALSAYYDALGECGSLLLRGVALSLGIAEDFFVEKYRKRLQRTQIVYYPPQPAEADADQFGVAPHTDFGCITLLWQDSAGGLEVQTVDGDWTAAPPIPGTFVVNVGDLLARWSNDRYRSTAHRVVNRSGRERFSIATFYDPDFKAIVDPADLGLPAGEAQRYETVSAGEHILGRINASFGYRNKTSAGADC